MSAELQPAFTEAFLGRSAPLPAAIALAPRKMRFAVLRSAFTATAMHAWLDRLASGQLATSPLSEVPPIVAPRSGESADMQLSEAAGSEEGPDVGVEELDLADIMAVDLSADGAQALSRDERLRRVRAGLPRSEAAKGRQALPSSNSVPCLSRV